MFYKVYLFLLLLLLFLLGTTIELYPVLPQCLDPVLVLFFYHSTTGQLWLGGRACDLLSEGRWFDSPGLYVKVSLGNKLLLMCWSSPCMQPPPSLCVCMNYCKSLWTEVSAKCNSLPGGSFL